MATTFRWPIVDEFINRNEELTRLESWWRSAERQPVALIGRRRVGKSWLFRRFAHGKPACILVLSSPDSPRNSVSFLEGWRLPSPMSRPSSESCIARHAPRSSSS
jgi:predicted AAA+ superfamily ATPase